MRSVHVYKRPFVLKRAKALKTKSKKDTLSKFVFNQLRRGFLASDRYLLMVLTTKSAQGFGVNKPSPFSEVIPTWVEPLSSKTVFFD